MWKSNTLTIPTVNFHILKVAFFPYVEKRHPKNFDSLLPYSVGGVFPICVKKQHPNTSDRLLTVWRRLFALM